jgi:predicted nucleic-acid-binding Zn-ribbon protein
MLDKYLYNMSKASKKFPAVMTTKEVLGIEQGTVLTFDWASGKYVSIVEEEDIADDYFYSGSAIALDPYIVKDNIGTYFTHIEQEPETEEEGYRGGMDEEAEQMDAKEADILPEESIAAPLFPEYNKVSALVVDCSCGHRNFLYSIPAPGVTITLMAEDENSFLELKCPECGYSKKLWLTDTVEVEKEKVDELTKEESN